MRLRRYEYVGFAAAAIVSLLVDTGNILLDTFFVMSALFLGLFLSKCILGE